MRKISLENRVDAIIARDSVLSYPDVISTFEITPRQFHMIVTRDLGVLLKDDSIEPSKLQILKAILKDDERKRELFYMEEEFLKEQYGRIKEGDQKQIYDGTYSHPKNVKNIVYHALTSNNPKLASTNREEVIKAIKQLPKHLKKYLVTLGLEGLMLSAFEKGERGSPLAVIKIFDEAYQDKTGGTSLFDLSKKNHLHEWEIGGSAPSSYWQNPENVEKVIYHVLAEDRPQLASDKREEVITELQQLPSNLERYFYSLGLVGLMKNTFEKGEQDSPLAVLKVFDIAYQAKTGDVSLFDLSQKFHLHEWKIGGNVPNYYWQNPKNVGTVVYHILTENNPELASTNREEVIKAIQKLPENLQKYLHDLGLVGLMTSAFEKGEKNSPLAVIKVFDIAYQAKTGDVSLFDQSQLYYLKVVNRKIAIGESNMYKCRGF